MNSSLGEAITRASAEELFPGEIFIKTRRLEWLEGLELDCYNEYLSLALEYSGAHHRRYVPHYHREGPIAFNRQQARDRLKADLCACNGVWLIIVPDTVPLCDIRGFVHEAILDLGWGEVLRIPETPLDVFIAVITARHEQESQAVGRARHRAYAEAAVCISEPGGEPDGSFIFSCRNGHRFKVWLQSFDNIALQRCPECHSRGRKTDAELRAAAMACGYQFLATFTRVTTRTYRAMRLLCPVGHYYEADVSNFLPIHDGTPRRGCIRCARKRTNQERGEIERGWRLRQLGIEAVEPYADRHVKVLWMCTAQGHVFHLSYNSLINREGVACLECR